jgi:hypothetical protein
MFLCTSRYSEWCHRFGLILAVLTLFPGSKASPQGQGDRSSAVRQLNPSLIFEANRGQVNSRISFIAHGLGYALNLCGSEVVLSLASKAGQASRLAASEAT